MYDTSLLSALVIPEGTGQAAASLADLAVGGDRTCRAEAGRDPHDTSPDRYPLG